VIVVKEEYYSGSGRGGDYNRRWIEEIGKLDEITPGAVRALRDQLVDEFGLNPWRK
jgi:hypothetical protein